MFRKICALLIMLCLIVPALHLYPASAFSHYPSEADRQLARANYDKSLKGDFWAIEKRANDWFYRGTHPDFVPNPVAATQYMVAEYGKYRGEYKQIFANSLKFLQDELQRYESEVARAEQGEPQALYFMALRYETHDKAVVKSPAKATEYLEKASAQGHGQSSYRLALANYNNPTTRNIGIAYMQKAHQQGVKNAAGWLRDWKAPLSPEQGRQMAAAATANVKSASTFAPGTFAPLFWGSTTLADVSKRVYSRSELLPLLEQVKANTVSYPPATGYKAWGLGFGTSPTQLQLLKSAKTFTACILNPVTPNMLGSYDVHSTASVEYEVWEHANRKAIRIGCSIEHLGFRAPSADRLVYYLVDNRLVAVQANVAIYGPAREEPGGRIVCSAPTGSPANLVANERRPGSGWTVTRQISLSRSPLSGIRYGDWFTLTRPGVVMHIFPKIWPNLTIEGTSNVSKCGTGVSEYLLSTPEFDRALQIDSSRLPRLRVGKPATLLDNDA